MAQPALIEAPAPRARLSWSTSGPPGLLAALPLLLMLASDVKLRLRPITDTVAGAFDGYILLEIAVFAGVALVAAGMYPAPGRRFPALAGPRGRPALVPVAAGAFLADLIGSAAYSPFPSLAVVRAAELAVWAFVAVQLARSATTRVLHLVAHGFVGVTTGLVVIGAVVPHPTVGLEAYRFSWLAVHPVVAGSYLGLSVTLLVVYLAGRRWLGAAPRWPGWAYLLLLVVDAGALVRTATRGALVAAVVAAVVTLVTIVPPRRRWELLSVTAVSLLAVALCAGNLVVSFMARGESTARLATLNARTDLWSLAWAQIVQDPLFGHGLAASRGIFLSDIALGGGHNAVINVLVDQGAVGLVLYLVLCLAILGQLRRSARGRVDAVDVLLVRAVLVFLLVDGVTVEYMVAPVDASLGWFLLLCSWCAVMARLSAS